MAWPPPALPTNRTNATDQWDNHVSDHNGVNAAMNDTTTEITANNAAFIRGDGTAVPATVKSQGIAGARIENDPAVSPVTIATPAGFLYNGETSLLQPSLQAYYNGSLFPVSQTANLNLLTNSELEFKDPLSRARGRFFGMSSFTVRFEGLQAGGIIQIETGIAFQATGSFPATAPEANMFTMGGATIIGDGVVTDGKLTVPLAVTIGAVQPAAGQWSALYWWGRRVSGVSNLVCDIADATYWMAELSPTNNESWQPNF